MNFEVVDQKLQGWIDIPKQGVSHSKLSSVQSEGGKVYFEMRSNLPVAVFESEFLAEGSLSGEYRQMGFRGTFALARAEAPLETPVAQVAIPYLEEEVVIENGEVRLAGTLTLPKTNGPHPAIVSGSGLQDRNSGHPSPPGYEPFKWLADQLTRKGIVVLRYDDRGTGKSTSGEMGLDTTLDYLLTRPDINHQQIGVLGHSDGAHIAAIVTARRSEVVYVVSIAGMAVDGKR